MAQRVEDLNVWQRAHEFWVAVNAIINRSWFQGDPRLRDQVKGAADSILSNMAEGFEQPTDRGCAKYLYTSKASTAEVSARLLASYRGYITKEEFETRNELGDEVARMTTGLIRYLVKSDRKDRGLGAGRRPKRESPERTDWDRDWGWD